MALRDGFTYEGYAVLLARDGVNAADLATHAAVDLMILDVMLPRLSGLDVCRQLRNAGNTLPIIMLTARGQEVDKVLGLKLGADDYVTKPFSFLELLARAEAVLRRTARPQELLDHAAFGDVVLHFATHQATKGGRPLALSFRECMLLRYLLTHRGGVVSREQLLQAVWGYEAAAFTRTVDMHIAKLRKKIEDDPAHPQYLVTIHGVGYKFLA